MLWNFVLNSNLFHLDNPWLRENITLHFLDPFIFWTYLLLDKLRVPKFKKLSNYIWYFRLFTNGLKHYLRPPRVWRLTRIVCPRQKLFTDWCPDLVKWDDPVSRIASITANPFYQDQDRKWHRLWRIKARPWEEKLVSENYQVCCVCFKSRFYKTV